MFSWYPDLDSRRGQDQVGTSMISIMGSIVSEAQLVYYAWLVYDMILILCEVGYLAQSLEGPIPAFWCLCARQHITRVPLQPSYSQQEHVQFSQTISSLELSRL
jgi:hypothetical protein